VQRWLRHLVVAMCIVPSVVVSVMVMVGQARAQAARQALGYLTTAVGPDGDLVGTINLRPDVAAAGRATLHERAGAVLAMALAVERGVASDPADSDTGDGDTGDGDAGDGDAGDGDTGDADGRAVAAALARAAARLREEGRPPATTGLVVAALLGAEACGVVSIPVGELRALGAALLGAPRATADAAAAGERALGLLMLHQRTRDARWLAAAVGALECWTDTEPVAGRAPDPVAAQWTLRAACHLLPRLPDVPRSAGSGLSRDRLVRQVARTAEALLAAQQRDPDDPVLHGAFSPRGLTLPSAASVEGLAAARDVLPPGPLHERVTRAIADGIAFLERAQLAPESCPGCMPRAIRRLPADGKLAVARFNRRVTEVELDAVQHALGAFQCDGSAPPRPVAD
jgi:hypothetical protein